MSVRKTRDFFIDSNSSQCSWRRSSEPRMFRGLQAIRSRITFVDPISYTSASHVLLVLKLRFLRTNTAMAAANGAAGATAKTLKMENARGLLNLKDCG